jgi:hypothetical protein
MNYENYDLIVDDALEVEQEGWKVTDDNKADWCIEKIEIENVNYTRLENVIKSKI